MNTYINGRQPKMGDCVVIVRHPNDHPLFKMWFKYVVIRAETTYVKLNNRYSVYLDYVSHYDDLTDAEKELVEKNSTVVKRVIRD